MSSVIVFGCGGHGRVVAEAALAAGHTVLGFADDDSALMSRTFLGLPVLASGLDETLSVCRAHGASVALGVGDNRVRQRLFFALRAHDANIACVVHPSAVISPFARLGAGTVAFACAVVNADARVGENVILNTSSCVEHDVQIGNHAHLSPGVHLGGAVLVGEGAHIGVGAAVRNGISIGEWSVIGVGAAVVRDVPAHVVAFGNPARVIRTTRSMSDGPDR